MKDTATGKYLFLDPAPPAAVETEAVPSPSIPTPAEALNAIFDSLLDGGYDPVVQLSSYFVANDPTFLPEDTAARSLAHPVGRDKLLEALLYHYGEHRNHD